MSGTTLLLSVPLGLCLLWATGGAQMPRDALERGAVSLNDMFREVEELMEDTQHILEEAVDQINTESAKLSSDLLLGYNNGTKEIVQKGKGVARVLDRTDKETYNKTGETHLPHIRTEMSGPWNSVAHVRVFFLTFPVYEELLLLDSGLHKPAFGFSRRNKPEKSHMFQFQGECNDANCEGDRPEKTKERPRLLDVFDDIPVSICHVVLLNQIKSINSKQECMVDEDCGDLRYCLYEIESSKCLPCIPTDMVGSQSVLILFS
ncbi:hypothetical protein F2P81_006811 [Scophthalmus maximus]|uniref:Dickkopf N-terminal cysteine-rich domain-containing protein n=1 Tax=Scophthalmus maximus TaxID=52904 RepID=A0A6A4T4I2_SCOMX|nr:hypothetical protein F2P81_006811 [Scophthalmus maximus]